MKCYTGLQRARVERQGEFAYRKNRGIARVPERLSASQEGLCLERHRAQAEVTKCSYYRGTQLEY
jgi:hypothetical protein